MIWSDILAAALTIFLVIDPFGNAPFFNSVLGHIDQGKRPKIIAREMVIAFFILLGFLLVGNHFLKFMGLSSPALSIAGGFLLFIISLRMIFPTAELVSSQSVNQIPFLVPLAVPMVAGPSTISVLLLLSSHQPGRLIEWSLSLFIAWFVAAIILIFSPYFLKIIGPKLTIAIERLMGMILVILATQMLLNGVRLFIKSL